MDSNKIIKIMLADAGKSSRDLFTDFNTTKAAAATKVYKGIYSIKDFLIVANACDAVVNVVLKDGSKLRLTLPDETDSSEL